MASCSVSICLDQETDCCVPIGVTLTWHECWWWLTTADGDMVLRPPPASCQPQLSSTGEYHNVRCYDKEIVPTSYTNISLTDLTIYCIWKLDCKNLLASCYYQIERRPAGPSRCVLSDSWTCSNTSVSLPLCWNIEIVWNDVHLNLKLVAGLFYRDSWWDWTVVTLLCTVLFRKNVHKIFSI